jgi:hypothetical protein
MEVNCCETYELKYYLVNGRCEQLLPGGVVGAGVVLVIDVVVIVVGVVVVVCVVVVVVNVAEVVGIDVVVVGAVVLVLAGVVVVIVVCNCVEVCHKKTSDK